MVTAPQLLTAQDCAGHVHLIIGSGPLAASRCARSLQVGACPMVIAPSTSEPHYTLARLIEEGKASWVQRDFQEDDLTTFGREEVGHVVDTVFVTSGPRSPCQCQNI